MPKAGFVRMEDDSLDLAVGHASRTAANGPSVPAALLHLALALVAGAAGVVTFDFTLTSAAHPLGLLTLPELPKRALVDGRTDLQRAR